MLLDTALETFNASLETFHNLANAMHLVEFDLQFVNLAEDGTEAGNFSIGRLHCISGTVGLEIGRYLRLLGELARALYQQ